MFGLPLSFTEPLLLAGLLSLPVLWWVLRVTPPRPRRIEFPPTRLLFDIAPREETPSRTPWWLTALRLAAAALVIFAAAGPVWNPQAGLAGSKAPLLILLDDGWSAASSWDARIRAADELIAKADNDRRGVALAPLSDPARDITLMPAGAARVALRQLAPKPYAVERVDTLAAIDRFLKGTGDVEIAWLTDGVDTGRGAEFVEGLGKVIADRTLTIYQGGTPSPLALADAENAAAKMTVKVLRTDTGIASGVVRALDSKGSPIGDARFSFAPQSPETEAAFDLPVELRNDIARLEIAGERSAGAVQLLDKRWRRRAIGIVSGATSETAQPLLAPTFYLARALSPFADVRLGDRGVAPQQAIGQFLDQKVPMIIMADVGSLSPELRDRLNAWIDQGGVLVRFAGPRLAQGDDDLVPVKLRRGGRTLGGSLTWEKPQHLTAFAGDGPFAGLPVPKDVTVSRQVLAEPDAVLATKSWASLEDGTPLVTGEHRGKGIISLFHVSADMRWSDLPMSGTFVEMLRRIVDMSGYTSTPGAGVASQGSKETVAPLHTLDGFGVLGPPPSTAKPLAADYRDRATPDHPPGFYGPAEGPLAVNTLAAADRIAALDTSPLHAQRATYTNAEPRDLRGILLSASLALFLLDAIIVALLGGGLAALVRRRAAATVLAVGLILAGTLMPSAIRAESADDFAMKAVSQTRLAYVVTGNADVDSIVKAGMAGLTLFLAQRTALEAGDPIGVDPAHDELAFFPLIYWPIVPGAPKPPQDALNKIDAYMKQGGTVLFDTRDAIDAPPGENGASQTPGMQALRDILSSLDVPELEPVPREHVLTKTFYLLRDFPGRFTNGQTWVEALPHDEDEDAASRPARGGDGVSPIIITSNDLAGAWAIRPDGQPMLPLTPGEPKQREFAFRAGVNIVMYTLTGNYKADQVHAPALIERLGQ
ncbi:DUF4159 domain-containing protein [Bradyrhizobium sp. ARR65]|uniref:DUF4159 domain-containing protein n=1 Tax=Bradyrhizobium sp. ARR65 TaxID=1040989 RepID=UPI000463DF6F|nr:DUF4159 domain-containing protein [Bradyrhizobium sp. ARR65]